VDFLSEPKDVAFFVDAKKVMTYFLKYDFKILARFRL
jgi:hypothetical protein